MKNQALTILPWWIVLLTCSLGAKNVATSMACRRVIHDPSWIYIDVIGLSGLPWSSLYVCKIDVGLLCAFVAPVVALGSGAATMFWLSVSGWLEVKTFWVLWL